ncbi:AAA family ATPase [Tateyamaria sp. SN3-11]|uniref:AAA family ATPase n=1 Tax=Tateyamaria sp. SN3-11 TaxID=3092147 RepID=UPI0039EA28E2
MKIKSIAITNFRSIKNETIDCTSFNTFVGPNGSGKSTVLNALNLFFGEITSFSEDDFHNRNLKEPIIIRVIFDDLSDEAKEEFKHYVRADQLVVQAEVTMGDDGSVKKTVRGERLVFEPFKSFFEAKNATDRGKIFKELRERFEDIESATNDAGRTEALTAYEEALPEEKKELTISGAEFFGVSKGAHKFQRHICWVYVPAVKEASTESEEAKNSHLGKLIQHTIRSGMDYETDLEKIRNEALEEYKKLLAGQKTHLDALQDSLSERLQAAVTADTGLSLDWKRDDKSVAVQDPVAQVLLKDRGFEGEVDKFGHGLQRAFLLIILQELMAVDSEVSPTLVLGCEEPELYQHPPQARHLAAILMELSLGDAQVLVTTHSPYFIDVEHYEGIKMFRNGTGEAKATKSSFSSILTKYNAAFAKPLRDEDQARTKLAIQTQPKFNEVFFADKVVLVEGISDQACLETFLRLSEKSLTSKNREQRLSFVKAKAHLLLCC